MSWTWKDTSRESCIGPPNRGKRHVLVDTEGLLLHATVHAADIQDRDGGVLLMATLFSLHPFLRNPFLRKLYADGGYQGPQFQAGLRQAMRQVEIEIVKRSDGAKGFAVLPKCWIVTGCTELPNSVSNGQRRLSAIICGLRAVRAPKPD